MVTLAGKLARAYAPGVSVAKKAVRVPPGRLNVRTVVNDVHRTPGTGIKPKPFVRKTRTRNAKAELEIVFFGDVSASMSSLQEPLAVTRWMVTEAGMRVHAKISTILFGNYVYPVQRPGKMVKDIEIYGGMDGEEVSSSAWLFWSDKTGALEHTDTTKIAIWFTDFEFVNRNEARAFQQVVDQALRSNVLMIGVVPRFVSLETLNSYGILHCIQVSADPEKTASEIGDIVLNNI